MSHFLAIGVSIAGVIFVSQPGFLFPESSTDSGVYPRGSLRYDLVVVVCLVGAILAAGVFVALHKAGGKYHHFIMTFHFGFSGSKISISPHFNHF